MIILDNPKNSSKNSRRKIEKKSVTKNPDFMLQIYEFIEPSNSYYLININLKKLNIGKKLLFPPFISIAQKCQLQTLLWIIII